MKEDTLNASFETVRKKLKKYNVDENDEPPKLIIANKNDFLDLEHKRKKISQFVMGVKEFIESEKFIIERLLDDLETKTGRRPLAFYYDDKETIHTLINDFKDYYNTNLDKDLFQNVGSASGQPDSRFCLIIVVLESYYYDS
jgi:hypothetical protein